MAVEVAFSVGGVVGVSFSPPFHKFLYADDDDTLVVVAVVEIGGKDCCCCWAAAAAALAAASSLMLWIREDVRGSVSLE